MVRKEIGPVTLTLALTPALALTLFLLPLLYLYANTARTCIIFMRDCAACVRVRARARACDQLKVRRQRRGPAAGSPKSPPRPVMITPIRRARFSGTCSFSVTSDMEVYATSRGKPVPPSMRRDRRWVSTLHVHATVSIDTFMDFFSGQIVNEVSKVELSEAEGGLRFPSTDEEIEVAIPRLELALDDMLQNDEALFLRAGLVSGAVVTGSGVVNQSVDLDLHMTERVWSRVTSTDEYPDVDRRISDRETVF